MHNMQNMQNMRSTRSMHNMRTTCAHAHTRTCAHAHMHTCTHAHMRMYLVEDVRIDIARERKRARRGGRGDDRQSTDTAPKCVGTSTST